ncbi:MAG: T9SS type A sorting domain-containing protein [Bacteroidota bacterium]
MRAKFYPYSKVIGILCITVLHFFYGKAQNSKVGDGFGGRLWYAPTNYAVGSNSAYTVCGTDNQLYSWGHNNYGVLGNGTTTGTTTPVIATGMTNVLYFTSGYTMSAIKTDSTGWVWGTGYNNSGFTSTPQQVITKVKFTDAGVDHVSFVKNDGTVWSVGKNIGGQFGNDSYGGTKTTPVQMTGITTAVRVAAGGDFNIVLLANGTVKQAGGDNYIQAGNGSYFPNSVPVLTNVVDVKATTQCAFALTSTGDIYSWGTSFYGELGTGGGGTYTPTKITFPVGAASIVAISACSFGTALYALDANGNVYTCGDGRISGDGSGLSNHYTPYLTNTNCKDILCGESFVYLVKNDNSLWATGSSITGSIFMDKPNYIYDNFENLPTWVQLTPTAAPMNLCALRVVPVKITKFGAVQVDNKIVLNWGVGEQFNIKNYVIEHSIDGKNFSSVTSLSAVNTFQNYNTIDPNPVVGINYYRLRIEELNGIVSYGEIKKVNFGKKDFISVFPNPSVSAVNISLSNHGIKKPATITVIAFDGRLMYQHTTNGLNDLETINVSGWANGKYKIKIVTSEKIWTSEFVVLK